MLEEKVSQAIEILREKDIDLWLTFVRESDTIKDPAIDLILGASCTWQSAFILASSGERIALVGSLDVANITSTGLYREVVGYLDSIREPLLEILKKLKPRQIAINTSVNDVMSDGLTHGMYELLKSYIAGTEFENSLISSEEIISALRGRKSPAEVALITEVIRITEEIFARVSSLLRAGMSEKDVADFIRDEARARQAEPAWDPVYCPSVFTGPESAGAHAGPTDRKIEPGHVMNVDFGMRFRGFCSDLQRSWYFLKEGEACAPDEVKRAFQTIRNAITLAAYAIKPGVLGWVVDDVARSYILKHGYEEYPHGLGHQVGRSTHDGAGLLCPRWERYGNLPYLKIEAGQVYTLEPRITLKDYGVVTAEEIIVVTEGGCRFLSHPQEEVYLVSLERG